MRPNLRRAAFLFTAALGSAALHGADSAIWRLERVDAVAGASAEVHGAPQALPGGGLVFDGKRDGLIVPVNPLAGLEAFTIEILIRPDPDGLAEQRFFHVQDEPGSRALLEIRLRPDSSWALDTFLFSEPSQRTLLDRTKTHPAGRWTWVALTYVGGRMRSFVDGQPELEGAVDFKPMTRGRTSIGVRQNLVYWFKGAIREVRIHPRALAAGELQRPD